MKCDSNLVFTLKVLHINLFQIQKKLSSLISKTHNQLVTSDDALMVGQLSDGGALRLIGFMLSLYGEAGDSLDGIYAFSCWVHL